LRSINCNDDIDVGLKKNETVFNRFGMMIMVIIDGRKTIVDPVSVNLDLEIKNTTIINVVFYSSFQINHISGVKIMASRK